MLEPGRWPLVTAARMQELDRHTIDKLGIPGELLMECAGRAVVEVLLARFAARLAEGGEVCVVCGGGNNGGDGLVVARHLQLLGWPVRVALLSEPARLSGDAAANHARAVAVGVRIETGEPRLPERGVVVDAIFGTGLARPVAGTQARAIGLIAGWRGRDRSVLAVDLPSGLDADTGGVLGCAAPADVTVTLSLPKLGLTLEPGRGLAGEIEVARIGIADSIADEDAGAARGAELWSARGLAAVLPTRPRDGHKGRFGHVLVVAGSAGKTGAAALAALGAGRAGAGLVTIACPSGLEAILEVKCTEAMTVGVSEVEGHGLATGAERQILELARERDVVALGPGLGRHVESEALVRSLVAKIVRPLVLDADGLNALGRDLSLLQARDGATILTPHPGEAARLLGADAAAVNRDRVAAARELARSSGAVVLLKGAATVVADPAGRVIVNPTGGPALATGGTGDVLTGIVAAHLAQGLAPVEAAAAAAWLHGAAADRLARRRGEVGLLAGEMAEELPEVARSLREGAGGGRGEDGREDGGADRRLLLPFPGA